MELFRAGQRMPKNIACQKNLLVLYAEIMCMLKL